MSHLLCAFSISVLVANSLWARWDLERDAHYTDLYENTYEIEADGSYRSQMHRSLRVLTEKGREGLKTIHFDYQKDTSTADIIDARTMTGKHEYPVPSEYITDKPLADDGSGFDSTHRIWVAFPSVEIGSVIQYQFNTNTHAPTIFGHFSNQFSLQLTAPQLKGSKFVFKSKLPLKIALKNGDIFEVRESFQDGIQTIEVALRDNAYFHAVEELGSAPSSAIPGFVISSASSYDFLKPLAKQYEHKLAQSLPERFRAILETAAQSTGFENQANIVMAGINDQVRYTRDWRSNNGRFIPQDFAQVAEKRFGDCKDFASLTVKILRGLGYDAHVAFVKRALGAQELPTLPTIFFDHAIVHVLHEGKFYWLDPTNPISYTRVRPDIANRHAIVLGSDGVSLEKIPLNAPEENQVHYSAELTLMENGLANLRHQAGYQGLVAVDLQAQCFGHPISQITHEFISRFTGRDKIQTINQINASPEIAQSRVVSDLKAAFDVDYRQSVLKTSMGSGYLVHGFPERDLSKIVANTSVNGIFLKAPKTHHDTLVLKQQSLQGKSRTCQVTSPWLNLRSSIRQDGDDIRIEKSTSILTDVISNEDLKSSVFADLQKSLNDCADDFMIILKPKGNSQPRPGADL